MIGRSEYTKTTSGIVIGGAYVPPAPPPSRDAEFLQAALLSDDSHYGERALDFVERHLTKVAIAIIVSAFVIGAIKGLVR